jgi:hypothetical protein
MVLLAVLVVAAILLIGWPLLHVSRPRTSSGADRRGGKRVWSAWKREERDQWRSRRSRGDASSWTAAQTGKVPTRTTRVLDRPSLQGAGRGRDRGPRGALQ